MSFDLNRIHNSVGKTLRTANHPEIAASLAGNNPETFCNFELCRTADTKYKR